MLVVFSMRSVTLGGVMCATCTTQVQMACFHFVDNIITLNAWIYAVGAFSDIVARVDNIIAFSGIAASNDVDLRSQCIQRYIREC